MMITSKNIHRQNINKTDFSKTYRNLTKSLLSLMKQENKCLDFYMDNQFILINGDCIEVMAWLVQHNILVDHIIADIPYGTVQGLSIEGWKNKGNIPQWDKPIDVAKMIEDCFYISKANANLLLFSQEPMTRNILNQVENFQKYSLSNKMIWLKNNHANGFSSKTTPVNIYEEILLFRKSLDETNSTFIRNYFKNILTFIGLSKRDIMNQLGQGLDHCFRFANRTFYIPTEKNYEALIQYYHIDKMNNFIEYPKLKKIWEKENNPIFNIPAGQNIVRNVFMHKKDLHNIHPTQKPLSLLTDLLQVFTNPGETVLDFTCGSASTGIAAIQNGRKFIGIELSSKFYTQALEWYKQQKQQGSLF